MDDWVVPSVVAAVVIVVNLIIAAKAAFNARRSADAACVSAQAAQQSAEQSERSANAAERSAEAAEKAILIEEQRLQWDRFQEAVDRIANFLNERMWNKEIIDDMLWRLPPGVDPRKVLIAAFDRWTKRDRDLDTLLRSHGYE